MIGDEYVRLCLELVTAEPKRLEGGDLRVQLFAAFHACWDALNKPAKRMPDAIDQEQRLEAGGCRVEGALGRAVETKYSKLNVGFESTRTQQLGLSAFDLTASLVHLEQAVAAVDVA